MIRAFKEQKWFKGLEYEHIGKCQLLYGNPSCAHAQPLITERQPKPWQLALDF